MEPHEGDWVLERMVNADGVNVARGERRPVASEEQRSQAWRLIKAIETRVPNREKAVISDLALVNYESESDAIQAASLLYRAAQSPNLLAANQLANALQRSEGVQRFQSAERRAVQALLALPADAVSRRAVAILERAHEVVLHEENRQRRDEVSRSLALASGPLGTPDGKKYLRELPLPSDAESRYALVLDFVAQVDAAVAAERVAGELEAARETYLAAEDDDVRAAARTEIVRLFECFDELALRSPRASRAAARDLPRRSRPRFYSDRLLRVLERVDALELAMPAPFLRAAARISREGAAVALRHGLRRSGLNEDQLRAVLAGLGRWGLQGEDAFRDARVLVERRSQLMAPLDQLAYIALEGSTEAAEQLYGREDLLKDIVQTAREQLSHNRERAELLLRASTAWDPRKRSGRLRLLSMRRRWPTHARRRNSRQSCRRPLVSSRTLIRSSRFANCAQT